jgi:hypothetical protein
LLVIVLILHLIVLVVLVLWLLLLWWQNPSAVNELQSKYVEGCRSRDLFESTKAFALGELELLLPGYFRSDEYYHACRYIHIHIHTSIHPSLPPACLVIDCGS